MTTRSHVTSDELQEYLDGRMDTGNAAEVRAHLQACQDCRRAHASMEVLDRDLHAIPLEETGPAFTATVIRRLNLAGASSPSGRLLERFAYAFGLVIVLAILTTVFLWTGVIPSGGQAANPAFEETLNRGTAWLNESLTQASGWLSRLSAVFPGQRMVGILLLMAGALALIILLDRFLERRLAQKG
jgi:anti-sigma factor RsiW